MMFQFETTSAEFLICAEDVDNPQRVVIIRDENVEDQFVPDHLAASRASVLSRMASFAERARSHPISLPRGWHQYKHNALVAFFATPVGDDHATRWIAEVVPGELPDVIFWQTTTSKTKSALGVFEALRRRLSFDLDTEWSSAYRAAESHFECERKIDVPDADIEFTAVSPSPTKGWTYDKWLGEISEDQRAFIDAPTSKSIRLRGPAGSGKTLALTLKAVKEVRAANENGADGHMKALIATHSWSLAAQIDESIKSMSVGDLDGIDVFPLLEIARSLSPNYRQDDTGFQLIGEDSYSGKQAQLEEILDLLNDFIASDWITFRSSVSKKLRSRFDSTDSDERKALAWDLLQEFGSVIGAATIFPGAGSESKYLQIQRMSWMLPLEDRDDKRVVFSLYCRYMEQLEARSLMTSDQVLADFLSHLETHAWNRLRKSEGYDLVFVDEFHLFSPLERQILHFLTRDVSSYPSIFMAIDPRQSPSEAFIGVAAEDTLSSTSAATDDALGDIANFELDTVHRFTPQILNLVKHVHHEFPTLELGEAWDIDFSKVESSRADGEVPRLISAASRQGEEDDIFRAIQEVYGKGQVAIAVVDTRQWPRFGELAARINQSAKYHVSTITGRSDLEGLSYRRKGLIVGPAEYLAGLQFDSVLVAGVPDLQANMAGNERTRLLSLLYLAMSRAEREVRIHVNDDDGGPAEVLLRAVSNGLLRRVKGSET